MCITLPPQVESLFSQLEPMPPRCNEVEKSYRCIEAHPHSHLPVLKTIIIKKRKMLICTLLKNISIPYHVLNYFIV